MTAPGDLRAGARRPGLRLALTGLVLLVVVPVASVLILVVTIAALGEGPEHTVSGAPAGVLAAVLVAGVVSAVGGLGLLVAAAVVLAVTRNRWNSAEHAQLRLARDTATTPGQAFRLQSTVVPGRLWRRLLPAAPVAGPLGVAVVANLLDLETPARLALLAALPGAAWVVVRVTARRRSVSAELRGSGLRAEGDADDQPALQRRAAAMATFAAARGLPYAAGGEGRGACNVVRGSLDGAGFTLSDRVTWVESQVEDEPVRTHLTSTATTVAVPFPTVIALAVTPNRPEATLRWSYLGPQVQLESAQFNETFDVYCDDPVRARLVLNPAVMAALLDWPRAVQLVLGEGELRLTSPDALTPPEQLDAFVALAVRIARSARSALV